MKWLILIFGILTNVTASVLIKFAVIEPRKFPSLNDIPAALTNVPFWLGIFFYGCAFLLYAMALSRFPLNIAHPILTAGAIALVALSSVIIFKEPLSFSLLTGLLFIIVGVILIANKN